MITIYEHLQDFDNEELNEYERREQLIEATRDYNQQNASNYHPERTADKYLRGNFEVQYNDHD